MAANRQRCLQAERIMTVGDFHSRRQVITQSEATVHRKRSRSSRLVIGHEVDEDWTFGCRTALAQEEKYGS